MAQDLSIEDPDTVMLITTRTEDSRLWFVNNKDLEKAILGYLAKYQQKYGVILYGFVIMGNHIHILAQFPNWNRASFMRDLNARIANMVKRYVPNFPQQSRLWARRYVRQAVMSGCGALEHYFYYLALQSVSSGLCVNPDLYPGYNSFHQAARGETTLHKVFDFARYNDAKRYNKHLNLDDFYSEYELFFTRLPGFEDRSAEEYRQAMLKGREEARGRMEEEARSRGCTFKVSPKALGRTTAGARPKSTKRSERNSHRPLVLTFCPEKRKEYLDYYLALRAAYDEASERYRRGEHDVDFPSGTYRPPGGLLLTD